HVHRFSHSRRRRSDCFDHVIPSLACRRRTSSRQLALRFAAVAALSFLHDVQPVSISELQRSELEDEEIDSTFSSHYSCSYFHSNELRVDAGSSVPFLFALRRIQTMALARMATRNRRRNRRGTNCRNCGTNTLSRQFDCRATPKAFGVARRSCGR